MAMATAPVRCELIDLTMSSPESSDVGLPTGNESVIVIEVIRYVEDYKLCFVRLPSLVVCSADGPKVKSENFSCDIDLRVRYVELCVGYFEFQQKIMWHELTMLKVMFLETVTA